MRLRNLVVASALIAVLLLTAGMTMAACGSCPGDAKAGAPAKSGGCGMGKPAGGGCGMGMQAGGGCGMMGMGRGRVAAKTHSLAAGQVTLASTPHGLMLLVTDRTHQGDANASVTAYGIGPDDEGGLQVSRLGVGRYALKGDVKGLDEVAVRVTRGATSEVAYFGLKALAPRGGCPRMAGKCGGGCPCGAECKCASGDRSNCKCGDGCKCGKRADCKCDAKCKCGDACACGAGCKQGVACKCGADCKCADACKCGKPAAAPGGCAGKGKGGCGGGCGGGK